jgi:thiamine-monophosphate kinase
VSPLRLGPGEEFRRIQRFLDGLPPAPGVQVGPGDDAAVLADGTVLSTDLSVEGIHFRLDWMTPEEAGYRAVAAALSDLAAMGAEPTGVLLSLAVPPPGDLSEGFMRGARQAADRGGVPVLGGDLARSPGPVFLDVTVVGRTAHPLLRSGARPGDGVWVTGTLGASAAAVQALSQGVPPSAEARRALVAPSPRLREAIWLRDQGGATAALDLSDGLAGDAGHLATASGLTVILEGDRILSVAWDEGGESPQLRLERALRGGEDYELLLTLPPLQAGWRVEEFAECFDLTLTRIGTVELPPEGEGSTVRLIPLGGGAPIPLHGGGWDHFATAQADPPL